MFVFSSCYLNWALTRVLEFNQTDELKSEYKPGPLDDLFLGLFRQKMVEVSLILLQLIELNFVISEA